MNQIARKYQPEKIVNGFYLNEKDKYPKRVKKDPPTVQRFFMYVYNEETGRNEGRWYSKEELAMAKR